MVVGHQVGLKDGLRMEPWRFGKYSQKWYNRKDVLS